MKYLSISHMNSLSLMEEDSVPQSPAPDAPGASASETPGSSTNNSSVKFIAPNGTVFEVNAGFGTVGSNVMIGTGQVMNVGLNRSSEMRKRRKAKKPLSENQEEPKPFLLRNISERLLIEEAFMLGRLLTLSDAKIDEIKADNSAYGSGEMKYQILAAWCKKDENPTIATLALALNTIERGDIADKLPK